MIETTLDDVIRVSACDTWGIWIEIEDGTEVGRDLSAHLGFDEAIQVRDALTKAIESVAGPSNSAVTQ